MEIFHQITVTTDSFEFEELARVVGKNAFEDSKAWITHLTIDESDPKWPKVAQLLKKYEYLHGVGTRFTKKEIADTEYFRFLVGKVGGYPQPEDSYKKVTYDQDQYCNNCGGGRVQKAPFKIKKPKIGKSAFFCLHWELDKIFMPTKLFRDFIEPLGVESRPVHDTKGNIRSEYVQLALKENVSILADTSIPCEVCWSCKKKKYSVYNIGFFPGAADILSAKGNMFLSSEYWGEGGMAFREIVVARKFFDVVKANKLKGVNFHPIRIKNK